MILGVGTGGGGAGWTKRPPETSQKIPGPEERAVVDTEQHSCFQPEATWPTFEHLTRKERERERERERKCKDQRAIGNGLCDRTRSSTAGWPGVGCALYVCN